MSMFRHIRPGIAKRIVSGLLLCGILFSVSFVEPKRAEAQGFVTVVGGIGTLQETISAAANTVISGFSQALNLKEFTLDGIAHALAKKVLAQTTRSIVDWINTGFEGKPAFITNLKNYLLNAADEVAGDFLSQTNFAFLCQPLQQPVRFIVYNEYLKSRDWQEASSCTLSGALGNIDTFFEENFTADGWQQWFEMVSVPQNNVYGAAAIGISRIQTGAETARHNSETEAIINDGYQSIKDCSTGTCVVLTPGKVISEYLNFSLTVGDRTLIEADEINEIIGALFNQLATQAITGVGGLLGLSYSSDGTSPSYLDQFGEEIDNMGSDIGDDSFIDDSLRIERQYLSMFEQGLGDLEDIADDLESCTASGAAALERRVASTTATYELEIETTEEILSLLTLLQNEYSRATDVELKQVIAEEYGKLRSEGLLHSAADVELAKQDIASEVVDLEDRADRLSCN